MEKYFFDLHIHSALSPCADNEMTPNNIVNMSVLKKLDFISITDHNSMKNVEAVIKCSEGKDIIIVPGMEVETSEEIHVITLFKDIDSLKKLASKVYDSLPNIKNRVDIFGEQLVFDYNDQMVESEEKLLLVGCGLSIDEVIKITRENNGIPIPAHINRESNSILSSFGYIPLELNIKTVEISNNSDKVKLLEEFTDLNSYKIITSSDAHRLKDILEPIQSIELQQKTIECLIDKLNSYINKKKAK